MKVFYRFGVMNSAKTANLLMVKYNYESRNKAVFLIKPTTKKVSNPLISTRAGLDSAMANVIVSSKNDNTAVKNMILKLLDQQDYSAVMIDEAQFLNSEFIEWLIIVCNQLDIDILAYGLKTDFNNKLFPGTATWFALADKIEEVKTICDYCNSKAIFNKLNTSQDSDGNIHIKKSDYNSVCRNHF